MNPPASKFAALAIAIGTSLLFVGVYGFCNSFTARRSDVGTLNFDWEASIPVISWLIIPYMSIDLFFVAAPFLCRERSELAAFAKRIVFVILVAGTFFLLMPFRFAYERPVPDDWTAPIFRFLHGFDAPYNMFPSLHIALRTILAYCYARHTRGVLLVASHVWFSLVGFSTIFTYQHHVLDVVGGFALAAVAFYLIRESPARLPVLPNARVGAYYLFGGACCAALGWWLRPWGYLLLWPATSLLLMALAYFGGGPGVYRKQEGRLPLSTWVVLGPCLFGQWLSLVYYRRQCRPWDEVAPGVWIGRRLNRWEAADAVAAGIIAVLDLTAEFAECQPFRDVSYLNIPVLDLTAPTSAHLQTAVAFIADHAPRGIVYVHCKIGYSRSAAVVGAYLLHSTQAASADEAIARLRQVRPSIVIRPEAREAIERFEASVQVTQTAK